MAPDLDRQTVTGMLARIRDDLLPAAALSDLELEARRWRREVVEDLGGLDALAATKVALVDLATASWLLLQALDREVFELAEHQGLVDLDRQAARPVVLDRMRVADGLVRQLVALGLERRAKKAVSLSEYLASRQATPPFGAPPEGGTLAGADQGAEGQPAAPAQAEGS